MRVEVVAAGVPGPGHALSSFVIDGTLAIDAGGVAWAFAPEKLAGVTDYLLTHSHLDHVAGLPIALDTVYGLAARPPAVYGRPATLAALQNDLFNGRLMPDFVAMSRVMPPFLTLCEVTPRVPFKLGRYAVTAFAVAHPVPTVAYLVSTKSDAVAVVTDTAPVPELIDELGRVPNLSRVYLECSFPDRHAELARVSGHLTTSQHRALAARLPGAVEVVPVHLKPAFAAEILGELGAG